MTIYEQEFQNHLHKLMDDDKCSYVHIKNMGRFAVTSNILESMNLKNKQNIDMDTFRAIVQLHEKELITFQTQILESLL